MKTITTVEMTCCNCGTCFAMDEVLRGLRRADGKSFFCPNGHEQQYTKSVQTELNEKTVEIKVLQEELRDAKIEITRLRCERLNAPESGNFLKRVFARLRNKK